MCSQVVKGSIYTPAESTQDGNAARTESGFGFDLWSYSKRMR